jgi:hypothetical protein
MNEPVFIDGNRYYHTRHNVNVTVRESKDNLLEDGTSSWTFRYYDGRQWKVEPADPAELTALPSKGEGA